ncbi:hypothetical protein [Azospirillum sp. sgz302134]
MAGTAFGKDMGMDDIDRLLEETALSGGYVAATRAAAEQAEEAFVRLLQGDAGPAVERSLGQLGFALGSLRVGDTDMTVVREAHGRGEGKGVYLIRRGRAAPILLEAPHRFKDLDTGTIAARLMAERPFAAAAWNSVPRWYEEGGRRVKADMAHERVSHFNAFTRAFARTHGDGLVVQLHGFENEKRNSDAGSEAGAIVSNGTKVPPPAVRDRARCLKTGWAVPVLLYPFDIRELGATTNTNAEAMRDLGHYGFMHVEMARDLRHDLARDAALRGVLADCLLGGFR